MMDVDARRRSPADRTRRTRNAQVLLVNETMARYVWPGQSALGKCVRIGFAGGGFPSGASRESRRRRAVSRSRRRGSRLARALAAARAQRRPHHAVLRSVRAVARLADARSLARDGNDGARDRRSRSHVGADAASRFTATSAVPLYAHARHYQDLIDPQLRSWRLGATLFSAFSMLALGIAAVGLVRRRVVRRHATHAGDRRSTRARRNESGASRGWS